MRQKSKQDSMYVRRECPNCGFSLLNVQINLAGFNYPCPECGRHRIDDFVVKTRCTNGTCKPQIGRKIDIMDEPSGGGLDVVT